MPGNSRARKASVTTAIEAYSTRESSSAAPGTTPSSSRPVGTGRCGEHDRVGVQDLGVGGSTLPRAPSRRRRPGPARAPWRPCGPASPAESATGLREPADPAAQPREHGGWPRGTSRTAAPAAPAACIIDRSRSSRATTCGTVARAESSRAWPAYTPPSRGSTSRSTTSRPKRSSTSQPTLTSWPSSRVAGSTASRATRASPARESTPLSASAWVSVGHAHQRARHRPELAARPEVRGRRRGVDEPVAEPGRPAPARPPRAGG